jgi:hypothetical protein
MLEWNLELDSKREMAISAEHAGKSLRDFIAYFFGCEECRSNFLKAYDECELDGCNRLKHYKKPSGWRQLPIWLFELHNAVNLRLMKEQAEEEGRVPTPEDELSTRWPTKKECPMCFKGNGTVDEETLLKHLRIEYWCVKSKPGKSFCCAVFASGILTLFFHPHRVEDATTMSYREELGYSLSVNEADYAAQLSLPPIFFSLLTVGGMLAMVALFYRKLFMRGRSKSRS